MAQVIVRHVIRDVSVVLRVPWLVDVLVVHLWREYSGATNLSISLWPRFHFAGASNFETGLLPPLCKVKRLKIYGSKCPSYRAYVVLCQ